MLAYPSRLDVNVGARCALVLRFRPPIASKIVAPDPDVSQTRYRALDGPTLVGGSAGNHQLAEPADGAGPRSCDVHAGRLDNAWSRHPDCGGAFTSVMGSRNFSTGWSACRMPSRWTRWRWKRPSAESVVLLFVCLACPQTTETSSILRDGSNPLPWLRRQSDKGLISWTG